MFTLFMILLLFLVLGICSLCFHLAGGILKLVFKILICLPCALLCAVVGIIMCCTLVLIPLGMGCFRLAGNLLFPFRRCFI